jgi:hypothetical protein
VIAQLPMFVPAMLPLHNNRPNIHTILTTEDNSEARQYRFCLLKQHKQLLPLRQV